MMHVWYAGAALTVVLHTGDLTAAYSGKGWKNIRISAVLGSGEPLRVSKQCRQHASSPFL